MSNVLAPACLCLVTVSACLWKPPRVDSNSDAAVDGDAGSDAAPGCPTSYSLVGGNRYRFVAEAVTWETARATCASDSGAGLLPTHLAVVLDNTERIMLINAVQEKVWLGLSDRVTTSVWRWVTGENTAGYPPGSGDPPWKGGQPNNGGGGDEDCVVMENSGLWDDRPCDDTNFYVCECDTHVEDPRQWDPQT